ncbi:sulfurtransferase complex subunit TusD [Atopomonas sediminilitoris]|uniref:sulfurtransferase complex subunit TusD n=1 Tax=Atopomonas sediminilitoris TaxID=2919919 RepID=UPI001F4EE7C3|nr:sulfurtransferase complex subunit TusD [Atopomonas sediminilitoris]MCJ8170793.1 sulfurtransferase complex subunit TusD [Atopomonas sediminilitoris]
MKFAIAVFSSPDQPSNRRALRFAEALLAAGHTLERLFFYQAGVHSASAHVVSPQDELDLPKAWLQLIQQHQLDAVVCIAAALKRGQLNAEEAQRYARSGHSIDAPWELSGLGQLHEAAQSADRLICFAGP